ncbi:hypothetical protein [Clostridium guangxiense]|uniref:hypothetical protein n=1 Tax=Clostridium guangxiense TaxID=1662055 RepID=UPI001E2867B0|nr:hypothetical protein [Clostridium guangxiense]MCD2348488.1 hypothetical protein [Clostridium guangxiense]
MNKDEMLKALLADLKHKTDAELIESYEKSDIEVLSYKPGAVGSVCLYDYNDGIITGSICSIDSIESVNSGDICFSTNINNSISFSDTLSLINNAEEFNVFEIQGDVA